MSVSSTEILPGRLFAVGGWLNLAGLQTSWLPASVDGFLPVQGFVLRDAGSWLLIDTGLPIHRAAMAAGIAQTVMGCSERRIIMTRREADCMLNLPWILRDFSIHEVLYAGPLDPLDFFQGVEDADIAARLGASGATRTTKITDGSAVAVGALRLEVLRTELRLLATNWFYEQATETLFSSDAFSFITTAAPSARIAGQDQTDPAVIARFMGAKMDWLVGIDPAPIIADIDRLQRSRQITRICPGFGCVIEGRDAVRQAFDGVRQALHLLSLQQRRPALGDFLERVAHRVHLQPSRMQESTG